MLGEKLGRGWPLLNLRQTNIDMKSFALSVEEDMFSRQFIMLDMVRFVHNFVGDLLEFSGSNLFLFNHDLDCLCIAVLCILQNFIAGGSECSKSQNTLLIAIDSAAHSVVNQS